MATQLAVQDTAEDGTRSSVRLYGVFWRWHFFAAAIVIPFVLWQSVTGSAYLWSEWWMDYSHPELRFVRPAETHTAPGAQVAAALSFAGEGSGPRETVQAAHTPSMPMQMSQGHRSHEQALRAQSVASILLSDDPRRSTIVLLQAADGLPYPVFVDPHDARVLGTLPPAAWMPGITRALHGGWPIKPAGSWLLELGDGWALVMLLTGLYLWWPRGRGFIAALWPRTGAGLRVLLRDLHGCVAVWFSAILMFFLISALPWTDFWGNHVLAALEAATGQSSPAGFSNGGASAAQMRASLPSLDEAVLATRRAGVTGTLDVRLAPAQGAPLFITNTHALPWADRTLLAGAATGALTGVFANSDLPLIPRLVAIGVHVHQGDLGAVNRWLNTAFAMALIWLSVTGLISWWTRRPGRGLAAPPKARVALPRGVLAIAAVICVALPLLGASVVCIAALERTLRAVRPVR